MLVKRILSKITFARPFYIIGIDGPTAVGKTFLADSLASELQKHNIPYFIYRLDWTLLPRSLREKEIDKLMIEKAEFEYEAHLHMDLSKALSFLKNITSNFEIGKSFKLYDLYNREDGGFCSGAVEFEMKENMVIILEGHYSHDKSLKGFIDYNLLLLAEPAELLKRKIDRASNYRDPELIKKYFNLVDIPSFRHYCVNNFHSFFNIFDNTDYFAPSDIGRSLLKKYIKSQSKKSFFDKAGMFCDYFSISDLRDRTVENELRKCLDFYLRFDFEASKLFGIAECSRNKSFTELFDFCNRNNSFNKEYFDFSKLYSPDPEYYIVSAYENYKLLFFANEKKIRIIILSKFTTKIYDLKRVFAEYSQHPIHSGFNYIKIKKEITESELFLLPNQTFVDELKASTKQKLILTKNKNPICFYEHLNSAKFQFLHRFKNDEELIIWKSIFEYSGFDVLLRQRYLLVSNCIDYNFNGQIINKDYFYKYESEEHTNKNARTVFNDKLNLVDGTFVGKDISSDQFISFYKDANREEKLLIWNWLLRNFSEKIIFNNISLKRFYRNLPSVLSDYYFALSIRGNSSIPFFTIYDLRESSVDIPAYLSACSESNTAFGIQASQNALDKQIGYLKVNPSDCSYSVSRILIKYLSENSDKDIPLWSLGIDHASSKLDDNTNNTASFLRSVFSRGMISSVCLDIESLLISDKKDFTQVEKRLEEWLGNVPSYVDIELNTGEKTDLLENENYRSIFDLLGRLIKNINANYLGFLVGPALGTVHHKESKNVFPSLSSEIYKQSISAGGYGNVLHGTSFVSNSDISEFVKNSCVRINFAGQYLEKIVKSLPENIAKKFGKTQIEWKTSFAKSINSLHELDLTDINSLNVNIKDLFLAHKIVLNSPVLDECSKTFFHQPILDLPDYIIFEIAEKCINDVYTEQNKKAGNVVLLASMIEVPDEEFAKGLAKRVYQAGIKRFHVDVGDGVYINRKISGIEKIKYLKSEFSDVSVHVHLMVDSPHLKYAGKISHIEKYCKCGADIIYLSYESFKSENDLEQAIKQVLSFKSTPGLAFNPDVRFSPTIFNYLVKFQIHYVQIMGVYPGRGGQAFIPSVINTISDFRLEAEKNNYDIKIEVDGGLTKEIALKCRNAGADYLSGWSLFLINGSDKIEETIKKLLNEI
ncbi:MAG TPA: class II fructose-bisphosphate aldolase [Bacteroidales bacterium]|nr:class II fructose-bisphosphate aldolase [Bacteroidales bacterium]